jgi:hypothetical protein
MLSRRSDGGDYYCREGDTESLEPSLKPTELRAHAIGEGQGRPERRR